MFFLYFLYLVNRYLGCPASKIITFPSKFKFFTVAVTLGKHNVTRKKHIIISSLYLFILHLLKYMLFIYSKLLPPINSLNIEVFGTVSLGIGKTNFNNSISL